MNSAEVTTVSVGLEHNTTLENSTHDPSISSQAKQIADIVRISFMIIICIVMFGVGCVGSFRDIITHFKHPSRICTGVFNQVIIMPLLALAFVYATQLPHTEAMGILIQGTSPGGLISNIFALWINGDVNLSISMTATTTLLALGSMPFWLFVFTKILGIKEELQIPFSQLGIALVSIGIPVLLGMVLRRYKPNIAKKLTKILTICGTIAICVTIIVSGIVNELSFLISWKQWVIAFLTPVLGMAIGYFISWIKFLNLTEQHRRTIAVETGMQNCQISQSVLVISYASNSLVYEQIRLFPLINSLFQIMWGILLVIVIRWWCCKKSTKYTTPDEVTVNKANREHEVSESQLGNDTAPIT